MSVTMINQNPGTPGRAIVDWLAHPSGALNPGSPLRRKLRSYRFGNGVPDVDVLLQPVPHFVSTCVQGFFDYDLDAGAPVLLADGLDNRWRLHLRFSRPVREVGTSITADALAGNTYDRYFAVLLDGEAQGQPQHMLSANSALSSAKGTAPYFGARCDNGGPGIVEVGIEVSGASLLQAAIGPLYVTP